MKNKFSKTRSLPQTQLVVGSITLHTNWLSIEIAATENNFCDKRTVSRTIYAQHSTIMQ